MRIVSVLILVITLIAIPCGAQGFGNECNPVGTWFGGSDSSSAKYLLRITAGPAGRYTVTYYIGFTPAISRLSPWSGDMVKSKDGYVVYSIALANFASVPPPAGGAPPDIWAVRARMTFDGCDTLKSTLDFFGGYKWDTKVPFLDPPDYSGTIGTESYRRMPTTCAEGLCPE